MNLGAALLVFLYIGVISFGDGASVVPELHRQLVESHAWLTSKEFADGYAIGHLAPGPDILCSIGFYGYRVGGPIGAPLAMLVTVAPGALICSWLGGSWRQLADRPWMMWLRRGLVAPGVGLMAAGVVLLVRSALGSPAQTVIALLVAGAVVTERTKTTRAVLLAGVAGAALAYFEPT